MKRYALSLLIFAIAAECPAFVFNGLDGSDQPKLFQTCGIQFLAEHTSCICNSTRCSISRGVLCSSPDGYNYSISGLQTYSSGTCPNSGSSWYTCRVDRAYFEIGASYTFTAVSYNGPGDNCSATHSVICRLENTAVSSTTATSTSTTSASSTSIPQCTMPGNGSPCDAVTLQEVVSAIDVWASDLLSLGDMLNLINSWADPAGYPPN